MLSSRIAKLINFPKKFPSQLFKLNEKQLAREVAIMELSILVEQRGSSDVADNVRGALNTIGKNEEFIKITLAVLITPE
ncbi:MAG: hypothetical protein ACN6Q5_13740 [Pseudomonas sp.]|uniref:hypothetical protein n=1 Tax=Pseudomonas sp. TaxID=306 RepID=UPI003D104A04